MSKKVKWAIISVVFVIILVIGMFINNIMVEGFDFRAYTTDNRVESSLEKILKEENSIQADAKIKSLAFKEYKGDYLGFFEVEEDSLGQVFIVSYEQKGDLGKNHLLTLNKVVKGDNNVVMVKEDNTYLILFGADKSKYVGLNILDKNTEKILQEIDFEKTDKSSYMLEDLTEKYMLLEYTVEENQEIKLELVQTSGE